MRRHILLAAAAALLGRCDQPKVKSSDEVMEKVQAQLKQADAALWQDDTNAFLTGVYDATFLASGRGDAPNLEIAALPGRIAEYKYAPVNVDVLSEDFEALVTRLSSNLLSPYVGDRADGLPRFSLLYIDEMRLRLNAKYDVNKRQFTWTFEPVKMTAAGPSKPAAEVAKAFAQAIGKRYVPLVKGKLNKYITQHATKILQRKQYRSKDKKLLQRFGMTFFVKLRFDLLFPWVWELDPTAHNKHFFPEAYRVVLAQHMVVLPTGELYRFQDKDEADKQKRSSSSGFLKGWGSGYGDNRKKLTGPLFGGTYINWSEWEFLTEHGPGPIHLTGETMARMAAGGLMGKSTYTIMQKWRAVPHDTRQVLAAKLRPEIIKKSGVPPRTKRLFDPKRPEGGPRSLPSYAGSSPAFNKCTMDAVANWNLSEVKGAMDHCVYLPVRVEHLLMEERMRILLGDLPVNTEVLYTLIHRVPGSGEAVKIAMYRQCLPTGWSQATALQDSDEAETVFRECQDARHNYEAFDYGDAFEIAAGASSSSPLLPGPATGLLASPSQTSVSVSPHGFG